jgi:hypothetical protein
MESWPCRYRHRRWLLQPDTGSHEAVRGSEPQASTNAGLDWRAAADLLVTTSEIPANAA